jgi:hypothetical protein
MVMLISQLTWAVEVAMVNMEASFTAEEEAVEFSWT